MSNINCDPNAQIERINSRIEQVVADYEKSKMKRAIWLRVGDIRRVGELTKYLRLLNSELAYLASQRRQWDYAHSNETCH